MSTFLAPSQARRAIKSAMTRTDKVMPNVCLKANTYVVMCKKREKKREGQKKERGEREREQRCKACVCVRAHTCVWLFIA